MGVPEVDKNPDRKRKPKWGKPRLHCGGETRISHGFTLMEAKGAFLTWGPLAPISGNVFIGNICTLFNV